MYFPYFKFGCDLEINSARTAAYVTNQCDICGEGAVKGTVALASDCDPLLWTTGNPPVAVTYTSPTTDPAPWYDAAVSESATFLGYRVLNVTKANPLDRPIARLIANVTGTPTGGVIAPFKPSAQRYNFAVLLFACDELSMEYGYRWLEDRLINGCPPGDTPCSIYEVEFRNTCQHFTGPPTQAENLKGRWFLKNCGLVEGPIWGEDPLPGMRKYVRRAEFSIVSEQPWTYGTPTGLTSEEAFPAIATDTCGSPTFEAFFCRTVPVDSTVITNDTPGALSFLVEVHADDYTMQDVVIKVLSGACPGGAEVWSLHVDRIPPENKFTLDTSTNTLLMTNNVGASVDGTPFIDISAGPISFAALEGLTGSYCVVIEADECAIRPDTWASITQVVREF
jgi:hypothetical protein